MPNFDEIMKMAQNAQAELMKTQEGLDQIEVEGASGGGLVKIRASAKGRIIAVESHMKPPSGVSITGTPPGKPAAIASGLAPGSGGRWPSTTNELPLLKPAVGRDEPMVTLSTPGNAASRSCSRR